MIDFSKFDLRNIQDGEMESVLKDVIKGALTGKEAPNFLQTMPGAVGMMTASLVFTAAKEIIASKAPLRVTPATDDDIACALKTERPLVIKSEQDLTRVTWCMKRIFGERYQVSPDPAKISDRNEIHTELRENESIEKIPAWSLPYLVNGDSTGLTDEEVETVRNGLEEHGIREVISPVNPDARPYFTMNPLFGKPAEVEDWIVECK